MLFDKTHLKQLHHRNISVATFIYTSDAIALEGRLTDNRSVDTHNIFGDFKPAGTVHDLLIRMIVKLPRLIIEAVEVEMKTVPTSDCPQAVESLAPLIGERISAGITEKVHQLVGGRKGCAHLVALTRAMASTAIQGAYSMVAVKPPEERSTSLKSFKTVIDTCHVWRSDGPMVHRLVSHLEKSGKN